MFWEIFLKLCEEHNEKPNPLAKKLKISSGTVTNWKNGSEPQPMNLKKIADYFGVSVNYLLGKEETRPQEPKQQLTLMDHQRVHMIPLFESVSAGFGALAVNEIVDYVPLYFVSPAEAKETICIKVHGDSMYPKIEDGDIIQVHKQESVDSGSLAVVLLDGDEGLVKKVVYGETWIELHSLNPMYKPMRFNGADVERIRVVGLVKKIIKDV